MAKRTPRNQEGNERDFHPTPDSAVAPLLPHLLGGTRFVEPCAGNGTLIEALQIAGHICVDAMDIQPLDKCIRKQNALKWFRPYGAQYGQHFIITNPPWTRDVLHALIMHLSRQHPTWLLFDADWMHTFQAAPYLAWCHRVVSVGRVKWVEGSKHQGKDNAAWYLFANRERRGEIAFHGRAGGES